VGHVARMGLVVVYTGFGWRNQMERDHFGEPCLDANTILSWIIRKCDVRVWT
jgi:hypothetical protein